MSMAVAGDSKGNRSNAGPIAAKRTLIVMAKEPSPGKTKTRLSPPLSQEEAKEFYQCSLLDTLELMRRVDSVVPVIAYSPPEGLRYFQTIAPRGFALVPQIGKDLGERLDHVLREHLRSEQQRAVVMNSDGPTLPVEYVQQAFLHLDDPSVDVVLGPSDDGGYYLIGLRRPCSALFDVIMSTATVLRETLERAEQRGLRAVCLPSWFDVDTPEDLRRLSTEIDSLPDHVAANTRRFLSKIAIHKGHRSDG